jgi:hypothetical protein
MLPVETGNKSQKLFIVEEQVFLNSRINIVVIEDFPISIEIPNFFEKLCLLTFKFL